MEIWQLKTEEFTSFFNILGNKFAGFPEYKTVENSYCGFVVARHHIVMVDSQTI